MNQSPNPDSQARLKQLFHHGLARLRPRASSDFQFTLPAVRWRVMSSDFLKLFFVRESARDCLSFHRAPGSLPAFFQNRDSAFAILGQMRNKWGPRNLRLRLPTQALAETQPHALLPAPSTRLGAADVSPLQLPTRRQQERRGPDHRSTDSPQPGLWSGCWEVSSGFGLAPKFQFRFLLVPFGSFWFPRLCSEQLPAHILPGCAPCRFARSASRRAPKTGAKTA